MHYDIRSIDASPFTIFGVDRYSKGVQNAPMLGANELLTMLRERGVKNAEIARVLDLPSSRIAEMFSGKRRLQLDEAKKLVETFKIEEPISALSEPIARLLVLYAAERLGSSIQPDDPEVEELAQDFGAFSRFAANPKARQTVETFEGFLEGLRHKQGRSNVA